MSTEWNTPPRYVVVRVAAGKRWRFLVWDERTRQPVPHPRGKRRAYSEREAFSVADALNRHPATRAQSHG